MVKMEIELTDEQYDKVNDLQVHGISCGDAIDLLFEIRLEVLAQIKTIDSNIEVYDKVKNPDLDADQKRQILEDEYGDLETAYEDKVVMIKNKIGWARDLLNF